MAARGSNALLVRRGLGQPEGTEPITNIEGTMNISKIL